MAVGGGATRPPASTSRTPRRRTAAAGALKPLRTFCADGGALTISPDPRPAPVRALLARVDAAYGLVGPGRNLRWLASDLAAAAHDAATGHDLGEQDDLYAALGAVSRSPLAECVRLGSAP